MNPPPPPPSSVKKKKSRTWSTLWNQNLQSVMGISSCGRLRRYFKLNLRCVQSSKHDKNPTDFYFILIVQLEGVMNDMDRIKLEWGIVCVTFSSLYLVKRCFFGVILFIFLWNTVIFPLWHCKNIPKDKNIFWLLVFGPASE